MSAGDSLSQFGCYIAAAVALVVEDLLDDLIGPLDGVRFVV
jgi:hypothetical protein